MQVAAGRIVSMEYAVALSSGEVIERTETGQPVQYLHGAGMLLPSLEAALEATEEGTRRRFTIAARDAYGERDESQVISLPKAIFPEDADLRTGARLQARTTGGDAHTITVRAIFSDRVEVDMNHPLAGQALHFDVLVREVRAAGTGELFSGKPRELEVV
jgi:FKBP-type peptidyl-prolyl cis-trans isomerase SlyD